MVQCFGTCSPPSVTATPSVTMVLPQFVFGGGWHSALYFTNTSGNRVSFPVNFFSETGGPLVVPSVGGSSVTIDLAPRATSIIEAPNVGSLTQAYASVVLPNAVRGYGVFRLSVSGVPDQEAIVPLSESSGTTSTLIWDETSFVTGIAIVNPSNTQANISVVVYDTSGTTISSFSISLGPGNKVATALKELPGLSGLTGSRGSAQFTAASGNLAVLGLRFNGVTFTSIPTTNE